MAEYILGFVFITPHFFWLNFLTLFFFLTELQDFAHNGRHVPRHQVVLCFGDEYPDPQRPRKMITAQVHKTRLKV